MELWIGTINLGLLYAFMALGTFITYRLYQFPDITVDGSFTTGAAVAAILIAAGWDPLTATAAAFLSGAAAGLATGFIHTRFRIEGLLAGILVMTGLYSVNLHIMGRSNVPLIKHPTFITLLESVNPGLHQELWIMLSLIVLLSLVWLAFSIFLRTDFGLTLIATGNNPGMVAAQGVSVNRMKIFGIAFSNGLVGISGALVAQYQGFADVGMGIGSIVLSLAAVIIGEALLPGRNMMLKILGVILGSVVFRFAVAVALNLGMNPNDLKIATAIFVLATLILSRWLAKRKESKDIRSGRMRNLRWTLVILVVISTGYGISWWKERSQSHKAVPKIGVILANQSSLLTSTRDGLFHELKALGYHDGVNCRIIEQNAQGEIPNNATIVSQMLEAEVDLFVPVSTASTQAVINKVKDKPVVFATVASPFVIHAGTTPADHLPNVTGVYGSAPVDQLLRLFSSLYPGPQTIGTLFNPGFPNTKVNYGELMQALSHYPGIKLESIAVSSTSEVYQSALALSAKGIRAFVLINDLTVFEAFEAVAAVSKMKKIPIFTNDTERLADGAMVAYGYDYFGSGVQAARIIDRILKGENPAGIPFEIYRYIIFGVNYDMATLLNIKIPVAWSDSSSLSVRNGYTVRINDSIPEE